MSFRDILQKYIDDPDSYKDIVLLDDENVVIIKDVFPKALRHYLIIPKSPKVTHVHPLEVFQKNAGLYYLISEYLGKTKQMIVDDLVEHKLLKEDDKLLLKEFQNNFIKAGVHSNPSLNNLHIHVITKDFHSPSLKHKKHYNSFNTKFFVSFEDLEPASSDSVFDFDSESANSSDEDSAVGYERDPKALSDIIKRSPLKCSYCGENFGNKFKSLKNHLTTEFTCKFNVTTEDTVNVKPNNL